MARTDNDTWDLASSVGATATMVASARAMASRAEQPLIHDEFAEPLVRAVGIEVFSRLAGGELSPADLSDDNDDGLTGMARMADSMAVRTRFFDDFFCEATNSGVRQAVILASGLDTRAYRLDWPAGTVVYEIDQPAVIEFKTATLAGLGAAPAADRRTVPVDLREDWPAALREAGFDPGRPAAWSAEGLLGYLPAEARDGLLDTITALSAPGSRIGTESTPSLDSAGREALRQRMQRSAGRWRKHGFNLDLTELIYFGDRTEARAYLAERGWKITSRTVDELFTEHGLTPLGESAGFIELSYIAGTLE